MWYLTKMPTNVVRGEFYGYLYPAQTDLSAPEFFHFIFSNNMKTSSITTSTRTRQAVETNK